MSATKQATADLKLMGWSNGNSGAELRGAFRRKSTWVVFRTPMGPSTRYLLALSNLSRKYLAAETGELPPLRHLLKQGLDKAAYDRLQALLGVSREVLNEHLRISARALNRRNRLTPDESERVLRVASAFQRALEVLGDLEETRRWFTAPARALGGVTPFAFCDTEPGAREVEDLLGRLEHGVFT